MTDCVVSGCYADFKVIKTRSVVQMVIEIPVEQGQKLVEAFGIPQPGQEIHVAVARLVAEQDRPHPVADEPEAVADPAAVKQDPVWARRAAMLCQEKAASGANLAAAYFAEHHPVAWTEASGRTEAERADACLKLVLDITSKTELDRNPAAGARFEKLSKAFWAWRNEPV